MAIKVYMKNLGDASWTDVTLKTIKADFKVRRGFSTIGSNADLSKMTITYKATDLASAAVFHTTAKQIKVYNDDEKVFEGYTEGSASVQTSRSSSLAFVKISAYPYLNVLKDAKNSDEIVVFDAWASNPAQQSHSILHILWNRMLDAVDPLFKSLIQSTYSITLPTIGEFRSIYRLDADSSLYDEFSAILGEFSYTHWLDGFTMRFSKPYADDERLPITINYNDMLENPSIKSAPYITSKRPVIKLAKVLERFDATLYQLDDKSNKEYEGIKDIAIGESYPDDGTATISYSHPEESEDVEFYYAQNVRVDYEAFNHKIPVEKVVLTQEVWNVGGTEAEIRLRNNTDSMVDIKQIEAIAGRAFLIDRKTSLDSEADGEIEEVEPKFLNSTPFATEYMNALVSENKSSTSTLSFSSGKISGINPNDILEIGDIPADYLVKYVETDIVREISKYECVMLNLDEETAYLKTRLSRNPLAGKDGRDAPLYEYIWSPSEHYVDTYSHVFTYGGKFMLFQKKPFGNWGMQDWSTEVGEKTDERPYLWCRIDGSEPFMMTGRTGADGRDGKDANTYRIKSVSPQNPIRNDYIGGTQKMTFSAEISGYPNPSPIWTLDGAEIGRGLIIEYDLPYHFNKESFILSLYDSSISESTKKNELVVNMANVTQTPIYEGVKTDVGFLNTTYTDGYTHSFMWGGENDPKNNLRKGYPMVWNGGQWILQTGITMENSQSLFQMIADGQKIDSGDGVFAWFNNLVAMTAAIKEIFTEMINVYPNGGIKSTDYISGSRGFMIQGSGNVEFCDAVMQNGVFNGTEFNTSTFSSKKRESDGYWINTGYVTGARNHFEALENSFSSFMSNGVYYKCSVTGQNVAYVKRMFQGDISINRYSTQYIFCNSDYADIGTVTLVKSNLLTVHDTTFLDVPNGNVTADANSNLNFSLYKTSNDGHVFKFLNLPYNPDMCEQGMVYRDGNTLKVKL